MIDPMFTDHLVGLKPILLLAVLICLPMVVAAAPVVVDFRDVALPIDAEHTQLTGGTSAGNFWNGSDGSGKFTSQGVVFPNAYSDFGGGYYGWTGWAYSNVLDKSTSSYTNQYAASTGIGVSGTGSTYAIGYSSYDPATLALPQATSISGMYVTNTTYAYFSMLNGDQFAKQFTPTDWFLLTINGLDSNNRPTGTPVSIYLAQNGNLVNTWKWVDLSGLGKNVRTLAFSLSSSDNGDWGMNTPAYFAMDDLTYQGPLSWTGASPAWSNAANWGGTALAGSQSIAFSGSKRTASVNNLPRGTQLNSMDFTTSAATYFLSGNGICLAGNLTNNSTSTQTIDLDIDLISGGGLMETTAGNIAIAGNISGSGGLIKSGSATLTLAGSNSYSGGTTVNGGILQVGAVSALPTVGPLAVDTGTLDLGSFTVTTTGAVSWQGGVTQDGVIVNNGAAYDGQAGTVSASLQGTAGLMKISDGTLVLSGSNGYSGGTEVDSGTLYVTNSGALPDGTKLTVGSGGVFIFDPSVAAVPQIAVLPVAAATVPEPGTLGLLVGGGLALIVLRLFPSFLAPGTGMRDSRYCM